MPGRVPYRSALAAPRGAAGRRTVPAPRRPTGPRATAAPLVAADATAVLLAVGMLSAAHRRWEVPLLVAALVFLLDGTAGLYRPPVGARGGVLDELPALAARAGVAWCGTAAVVAACAPGLVIGPLRLGAAYGTHVLVVTVARGLAHARRRRAARGRPRAALVVGAPGAARRFAAALAQHPEYGVRPVGIVGTRHDGERGLPVLTSAEEIHRAVIQNAVRDAVFLADDEALVTLFQRFGCATWRVGRTPADADTAPVGAARRAMNDHLWGYGCRRLLPPAERRGLTAKRALDLAVAGPALALALPVLLLCALAVRLSDGPGVLFRQERVGQHG
ncbi:sugar transferase, partial [Streptomyces sp. NPDC048717]|uniref:sugar transferase n=1 Tax=Streptomyces sp. NPDC048717 TaxID=3154928 RepID=UPI0034136826